MCVLLKINCVYILITLFLMHYWWTGAKRHLKKKKWLTTIITLENGRIEKNEDPRVVPISYILSISHTIILYYNNIVPQSAHILIKFSFRRICFRTVFFSRKKNHIPTNQFVTVRIRDATVILLLRNLYNIIYDM